MDLQPLRHKIMLTTEIAYLGPQGTFAHLVAEKRYRGRTLIPQNSIDDVFRYVQADPGRKGIVPIENSSGGTIYETVDHLIDRSCTLSIQEELSIKVRLALLGHKRESVRVLYSHFAPFHHCDGWIKENFRMWSVEKQKAQQKPQSLPHPRIMPPPSGRAMLRMCTIWISCIFQ